MYLTINIFSGDLFDNSRELVTEYLPQMERVFAFAVNIAPFISKAKQQEWALSHSSSNNSSSSSSSNSRSPPDGGGTLTEATSYTNQRLPTSSVGGQQDNGHVANPITTNTTTTNTTTTTTTGQSNTLGSRILAERRRSATLTTEIGPSSYGIEILPRDAAVAVSMSISYPTSPTPRMVVEVSSEKIHGENQSNLTYAEPASSNVYPVNSDSPENNIEQQNTADDKVMYI